MPDVEWIMENCHMMRDNGVWVERSKSPTLVQMENTRIT